MPVMARSIKISDPFARAVEVALEHVNDAAWLGEHSPLAAPYFLGAATAAGSNTHDDSVTGRGRVLHALLASSAAKLDAEQQTLLNTSFFRRDPVLNNTGIAMALNLSETTYYRRRASTIEALADEVNREAAPPWRFDMPRTHPLINRDRLRQECIAILRESRTVALSGAGGIGKTALGAAVARESGDAFWFTVRPGLNDHLNGFVFALAHFLREHHAPATWRQLVADRGVVDPARALGVLRHDLATTDVRPVVCVDEFDLLRADTAQHAQIVHLVDALRGHAPLMLMGQQVLLEADRHEVLSGLTVEEAAQLLAGRGVHVSDTDAAAARAHTRGNPALLNLLASLWREGESLRDLLRLIANAPSVEPLLNRMWQRIDGDQRGLLTALAVFDGAAPRDAWGIDAPFDALIGRDLAQADDAGGILLPSHVRAFVQRRTPYEASIAAHLAAGEAFEMRGEYTSAARHYAQAEQPGLAIWTWFNHRELEVDRGRATTARVIFNGIRAELLDDDEDKRALAIIRAELAMKAGAAAEAEAELSRVSWPLLLPATPLARQLQGDALEAQGRIMQALNSYREAWHSLDTSTDLRAVVLNIRSGYVYLNRERDVQKARTEATLALLRAHQFMAHVQLEAGEYVDARAKLGLALSIAERLPNNNSQLARTHELLCAVLMRLGLGNQAIEHARIALQLDTKTGDTMRALFDKLNLNAALIVDKQYNEAVAIAKSAIVEARSIGHYFLECGLQTDMAEALYYLNQLDDSEQTAIQALQHEEDRFRPYALTTLGRVQTARGNYSAAISYLQQALESARQIGERYAEAQALVSLGEAHRASGNTTAARQVLTEALRVYDALRLEAEMKRVQTLLATLS